MARRPLLSRTSRPIRDTLRGLGGEWPGPAFTNRIGSIATQGATVAIYSEWRGSTVGNFARQQPVGRIMIRRYDSNDGELRLPPSLSELRRASRLQRALRATTPRIQRV